MRYLYLRYSNNVYGYVRSIVRDDYEAEDITQHVFAKLMTVINRYEPRAVPFSRWLLRLAHNAAVDYLRSRTALPCEEIRLGREETDEGDADRLGTLMGALATLPEEQRNVLVLRHLVGLTPGEIAERMGKTRKLDPWPTPPRPWSVAGRALGARRGTRDKRKGSGMISRELAPRRQSGTAWKPAI